MKIFYKINLVIFTLLLLYSSVFAQQTAEEFYEKGLEKMKSGRYQEALPFFDEAIKLNSFYVEALLERSRARSNNKRDLPGALADIETILQINPKFGEAYFERAHLRRTMIFQMLKEKGQMRTSEILPYHKAILEDLNLAIENGFKNKRSYSYRAELQARHLDNPAEAIKDYTEALKFDPDDFNLLMNRSFAKRANDDVQGAIDDLREIINRYDEAKANKEIPAEKLNILKSAAIMALNNLSSTFALDEKPELQLWAIEKSIELQPNTMAYLARGRYQTIFGSLDDAIADYNKAIEMSGGKVGHYFMSRGIVYHLQGKTVEAEADFE
ncbi:MAG TPA: tetratricopeptide repeat protein, partial [Pyrinomonadaceae bacterium]|nr:tetratricopeptide repeat protein [Pyrinomonadaceae bacterium]